MADERHGIQTGYSYDPLSRPGYRQNLSSSSHSNRFRIVEDTLSNLHISTNGPLPPPPDEATLSLISDALIASTSIHHSISISSWPDSDESRVNLISLIKEDTKSITRTAKEKLKNEEGYSGHYDPTAHLLSIDEKDAYGKTFCPSCRKYFCSHGSCEWRGELGVDDLRGSHFFYHWIEDHSRLMFPCTCDQSFTNDRLFEVHVEQDLENHHGPEDATLMALIHCQDFFEVIFQNFERRVHDGYTELLPPELLKPVDPRSPSPETNSRTFSQTSTLDPLKVKAFNLLDQKVCQQFQQLLHRPRPPINRDPASTARLRASSPNQWQSMIQTRITNKHLQIKASTVADIVSRTTSTKQYPKVKQERSLLLLKKTEMETKKTDQVETKEVETKMRKKSKMEMEMELETRKMQMQI